MFLVKILYNNTLKPCKNWISNYRVSIDKIRKQWVKSKGKSYWMSLQGSPTDKTWCIWATMTLPASSMNSRKKICKGLKTSTRVTKYLLDHLRLRTYSAKVQLLYLKTLGTHLILSNCSLSSHLEVLLLTLFRK